MLLQDDYDYVLNIQSFPDKIIKSFINNYFRFPPENDYIRKYSREDTINAMLCIASNVEYDKNPNAGIDRAREVASSFENCDNIRNAYFLQNRYNETEFLFHRLFGPENLDYSTSYKWIIFYGEKYSNYDENMVLQWIRTGIHPRDLKYLDRSPQSFLNYLAYEITNEMKLF
jgi:hypothetical protein